MIPELAEMMAGLELAEMVVEPELAETMAGLELAEMIIPIASRFYYLMVIIA